MTKTKKKILLVDDDADFVSAITKILEKGGYQVISAPNSKNGQEQARAEAPDLIIIDIIMDTYSEGFSFIKALAADVDTRDIPRIILSSLGIQQHLDMVFPEELGTKQIMQKPVKTEELLEVVRSTLVG